MRPELRRDGLDRLMDLFFVGHVGGEAVHVFRVRMGRQGQLEIDDGDLIDDLMFEERVDDAETESARAAGDYGVFHRDLTRRSSASLSLEREGQRKSENSFMTSTLGWRAGCHSRDPHSPD